MGNELVDYFLTAIYLKRQIIGTRNFGAISRLKKGGMWYRGNTHYSK